MDQLFHCPDCGETHDEPGTALLGHRVRCLDCQIESDLAAEFAAYGPPAVAA